MTTPVLLAPCPFCEGPPVPMVANFIGGGEAERKDDYGDDGLNVEAFVFCHECGAQGPSHDAWLLIPGDHDLAEAEGVRLWNERDARHRGLYDAGKPEGLNLYPRPDARA